MIQMVLNLYKIFNYDTNSVYPAMGVGHFEQMFFPTSGWDTCEYCCKMSACHIVFANSDLDDCGRDECG